MPYITTKRTLGEASKPFEAFALLIDMTNNALPPGQVTHGWHLFIPKTRLCLLSIVKMAKLGFWPTLALYHSQIDPWRDHATLLDLSTCDIHDKQCTASVSSHSWGLFTFFKNSIFLLSMAKNGGTGLWAISQ